MSDVRYTIKFQLDDVVYTNDTVFVKLRRKFHHKLNGQKNVSCAWDFMFNCIDVKNHL